MSWAANPLLHAAPVSLFILGLFYYWFGVADRYAVFLYGHLGATPFDNVTTGRYWMAGLVASGLVMMACVSANWLMGRIAAWRRREYCPPAWQQVWGWCALPLAVGILLITMTLNSPRLPLPNAAACVVAALTGLAFALMPGSWAAQQPANLVWLVFDGAALAPSLLLLRAVELPGRGLVVSAPLAYALGVGSVVAGLVWLGIMTGLRARRRKAWPSAGAVLAAGACLSYLLLPVAHYVLATPPGYRYISAASNFFAYNGRVQLMAWAAAASLAVGITRWRQSLNWTGEKS